MENPSIANTTTCIYPSNRSVHPFSYQSMHAVMSFKISTALPDKSAANLYFPDKVVVCGMAPCHTLLVFQKAAWTRSAWGQTGAIHFLGTGRHEHTSSIYNLLLERTVFKWGWKDKTAAGKGHCLGAFYLSANVAVVCSRKKTLRENFVGKKKTRGTFLLTAWTDSLNRKH